MKIIEKKIKAYKAFDCDFKCKDFQFKVGETYEHQGEVKICQSGFHACTKADGVFKYYNLVQWNRFAEVELWGDIQTHDDSKIAGRFIHIIKELTFDEFIQVIGSNGISRSNGISGSNGISESFGLYKSLFCSKVKNIFLFNNPTTEQRADEIRKQLNALLNGWFPEFNNIHILYLKYGSEWEKTPINRAQDIQKEEAWKDMPKEAIEYLKSLPEFDAVIFKEVTGISL